MNSQFEFLVQEWKDIYESAAKAEALASPDPRTSCFYAWPANGLHPRRSTRGMVQDATIPMLEVIRRRLRELVQFIEKKQRKPIYTNFEDMIWEESNIELADFVGQDTFELLRDKAIAFLREHLGLEAVRSCAPMLRSQLPIWTT